MKRKLVDGDAFTEEGVWVESRTPDHTSFYAVVFGISLNYKGCCRGVYLAIWYLKNRNEYHLEGSSEGSLAPGSHYNLTKRIVSFGEARKIGLQYVRDATAFVQKKLEEDIEVLQKDIARLKTL